MPIIYLFILCFFLSACASPNTHYPTVSKKEIEQERYHHERLSSEYDTHQEYERNRKKALYYDRLARVAPSIRKAGVLLCHEITSGNNCDFDIEMKDSDEVNAYTDGKKIYVHEGFMHILDNDTELATILSHEYAHAILDHVGAQTSNSMIGSLIGTALDIAASSYGYNTGSLFSRGGQHLATLKHSKAFEREADYVGLYIMERAGYTIEVAPELWRKMSIHDKSGITHTTTHPTNPERFVALTKTVEEIRSKKRNNHPLIPKQQSKKNSSTSQNFSRSRPIP